MTKLLQQAIDATSQLPPDEQDAVAARILEDLADDARWDAAFGNSHEKLEKLAEKVRKNARDGKTIDGGFDSL